MFMNMLSILTKPRYLEKCRRYSTIFNLSSGFGKCGVAVIRVSGQNTMEALHRIVSKEFKPKKRVAYLRMLYHPKTNELIDEGLVLWFPGPHSFTGEDSCEFQVHGSTAVINAMLDALAKIPGLRTSKNGEFVKRAFLNGKMDLVEVDGLADLLHAETEAQRKQAIRQKTASLSTLYKKWAKSLTSNMAYVEAFIDFAENEPFDSVIEKVTSDVLNIYQELSNHLNDRRQGEILRTGVRTAIIGSTNVGKSSCFNLICQRKASIVSSMAGTTRDIVESFVDVCGYPVIFLDTAGLRRCPKDVVEEEGIRRAIDCVVTSDLILIMMNATDVPIENISHESFEVFKEQYVRTLGLDVNMLEGKHVQYIINKIDLVSSKEVEALRRLDAVLISCISDNIDPLLRQLEKKLQDICSSPVAENPRLTQFRYRQLLLDCKQHIELFLTLMDKSLDVALASQELRKALTCIGTITGEVRNDDILDVIFSDFCIGK